MKKAKQLFFWQVFALILNDMPLLNGYELFRHKENYLKVNPKGREIGP